MKRKPYLSGLKSKVSRQYTLDEHLRKVNESEITFYKINDEFQFNLNGQVFVTNDFHKIAETINDMSVDSIRADILENRNTIVISYHADKH